MARCYVTFDGQNGCCRPLDDSRVFEASHHFFRVLRRQVLISIAVRRKFPLSPSIDGVDRGMKYCVAKVRSQTLCAGSGRTGIRLVYKPLHELGHLVLNL